MFHARKRFGQNFLVDENILFDMSSVIAPHSEDHFIEIGPGKGALTQYLLPRVKRLDAIEIDHDLVVHLYKRFANNLQLIIHEGDALTFDLMSLIVDHQKIRVAGNLPYNISTPILFKLFSHIHFIQDMHFLLQKEVVLRLTAIVGSSNYGRLSVMSQYFCDNINLFEVEPESFQPIPKVISAFVRMVPHKQPKYFAKDIEHLSHIVREAFTYRRKTISNALKKVVSEEVLKSLNINPKSRPQELSVEDYVKISNIIIYG